MNQDQTDPVLVGIERRHLAYFIAAADHGGFSGASQKLFITPTAVARAIRQLERKLGVTLFARTPVGSVLTPEGEAALAPARLALQALSEVTYAVDRVRGLEGGHLEVLALPTIAGGLGPELIGRFHQRFPGVRVSLKNPPRPYIGSILESIETGIANVGLTEDPQGEIPGFTITALPPIGSWAVFPGADPPLPAGGVTARRVAQRGLIVGEYWESSTTYSILKSRFPALDECVVIRTTHRESIVDLAIAGAGVAVVDSRTASLAQQMGARVAPIVPNMERRLVAISLTSHVNKATWEFHRICADMTDSDV